MNDERISEALRSLPREEASPYFTAAVMRRLGEAEKQRRFLPLERLVMVAAAIALFAAIGLGLNELRLDHERQQERQASLARLEALETERTALEAELQALHRLAHDARPTVYLSSTPDYDVVLDMTRLARRSQQRTGRTLPAMSRNSPANSYTPVSQGENRR
jgi:hypothetical protein